METVITRCQKVPAGIFMQFECGHGLVFQTRQVAGQTFSVWCKDCSGPRPGRKAPTPIGWLPVYAPNYWSKED